MHELSLCQSMLLQVETIAAQHQAKQVSMVKVQIGPLSGIEPQLLSQAFPLASAGTVAAEAELVMETLPVRIQCRSCGKQSEVAANKLVCNHCGDWQTQLLSGDEMLLASVELEK